MQSGSSSGQDWLRSVPDQGPGATCWYVVFRAAAFPDGTVSSGYQVPGMGVLDSAAFNEWLTAEARRNGRPPIIVMLLIYEIRDQSGELLGGVLERRRDTTDGPYVGNPARIEFTGSAREVRAWRSTEKGLEPVALLVEAQPDPLPRDELFAGEESALLAHYGQSPRVIAARGPSITEDQAGLSCIVHLLTHDGRERSCAIGWHGTTPFVIEGEFERIGEALHQGRNLPPDQATWLRYAERYEGRVILEVRSGGASGDILVLTGDPGGRIAWHLIDSDGVELWRKAPEHFKANDDLPPAVAAWLARRA